MTNEQQGTFDLGGYGQPELVQEYEFEPIRGYPMLHWRGKRPFTSTQYYPAQLKEVHGPEVDGWRNRIYWGDNLQVMSHLLKEFRGRVQLVYIDPPFDSKADYKKKIKLRNGSATSDHSAFEEKQYTDIWTNDEYLQFMFERLVVLRALLCSGGSIYLHCDPKKGHHLRSLMDEVFGPSSFRNEIIWKKTRVSKGQSACFGSIHDLIYLYSKGTPKTFRPQYIAHSQSYIESHYGLVDQDGRRYGLWDFSQQGVGPPRRFGDRVIPPPPGKHWIWSQEGIDDGIAKGLIEFTSSGTPRLRRYLDQSRGRRLGDIWDDVLDINSQAEERLGYPTQKPEALLRRIVQASSEPGDIILDCFMGSGTAQAVAMKLGRRFIGADINLGAAQITTKRLLGVAGELGKNLRQGKLHLDGDSPTTYYTGFEVYNVNHYDIFRNPVEAKDLLLEALEVHRLEAGHLFDGEKDGRMVKILPVNRIATRQDLNELISGFDYKAFDRRRAQQPSQPVERVTLVCMGHEPDLAAVLQTQVEPFKLDVEVVDILRDKRELVFKRDSEARIAVEDGYLVVEAFYPMHLLSKLSLQKEAVEEWRELVESIMIDWNYDGAILEPAVVDIPDKNEFVQGRYRIPDDAGTIRVKITDLLSESLEQEVAYG